MVMKIRKVEVKKEKLNLESEQKQNVIYIYLLNNKYIINN